MCESVKQGVINRKNMMNDMTIDSLTRDQKMLAAIEAFAEYNAEISRYDVVEALADTVIHAIYSIDAKLFKNIEQVQRFHDHLQLGLKQYNDHFVPKDIP